jgi:antitoxin FitA
LLVLHAYCWHDPAMANVQIRDVPDDVHRRLKSQAALAGQSLNEYLLDRVTEVAAHPSFTELAERIRARGPYEGPPLDALAEIIRNDRDSR